MYDKRSERINIRETHVKLPPLPKDFLHADGSLIKPTLRALCNYLNCSVSEFETEDGMPRTDFEARLMKNILRAGYRTLGQFETEFCKKFQLRGSRVFHRMFVYMRKTEEFRQNEKERQLRARFDSESREHGSGGDPSFTGGSEDGTG